jgi:ABC-type dipeptide/oligopeptide/nickel transport system permease subunit
MEKTLTPWTQFWYPIAIQLRLQWLGFIKLMDAMRRRPVSLLGGLVVILFVLAAIFADQITVHDPRMGNLRERLMAPAWQAEGSLTFPLGTDAQGRDILTRIIHGARISLAVGLIAVSISVVAGTTLGAIAGYYRGRFDYIMSRFADLLLAFPFLIFAIGVMAFLGPGFWNLILALTFKGWVEFFRLVRGEMMAEKTREYVDAARVVGRSNPAIIVREILPNIINSVFVLGTLRMCDMIITEASLSFLGLGIQPPEPAWGYMVAAGRDYMLTHWWVSTMPGLAILVLVLSINLLGEGLRDILDPRLKIE